MIPLWGGIYKYIEIHKFTKQKHTQTQKLNSDQKGKGVGEG